MLTLAAVRIRKKNGRNVAPTESARIRRLSTLANLLRTERADSLLLQLVYSQGQESLAFDLRWFGFCDVIYSMKVNNYQEASCWCR